MSKLFFTYGSPSVALQGSVAAVAAKANTASSQLKAGKLEKWKGFVPHSCARLVTSPELVPLYTFLLFWVPFVFRYPGKQYICCWGPNFSQVD